MSSAGIGLKELISDITSAIVRIDESGERCRLFQPGVGPFGEPQLIKLIATHLNQLSKYRQTAITKRNPDLLIANEWAIEFKITRPFGENGKEAESWSVNLLHPYAGNVSTIGDCYKLAKYRGPESRAVVVIGYEHIPPIVDLTVLIESFEAIATHVLGLKLSPRVETRHDGLIHPIHQSLRIFAWEVMDRAD